MRGIFLNQVGRPRSGWRLLIFIAVFVAVAIPFATVLRFLSGLVHLPEFSHITLLAGALGAGYLCARYLEGLPFRSLGLTFHNGWLRDLLIGLVLGFASLLIAVAIASPGLSFSIGTAGFLPTAQSMTGLAVLLFIAALAEEAMFRGYVLQSFSRAKLAWLGILLTSVPFGLAHLSNPNVVRGVTFANTALAGIWLAAAYLRTRSLWLPLGIHWSWNWALGGICGIPISGMTLGSHPLITSADKGPNWLTGGSYGIEGGVACTISLLLITLFLWRTKLISATPELKRLTSEENPVTSEPVLSIRPADM